MTRILIIICFLFPIIGANVSAQEWTEKQLGRLTLNAEKNARRDRWDDAIELGEEMVLAVKSLDGGNSERYANLLTILMGYYDDAGRINAVLDRTQEAYTLTKSIKGQNNYTTNQARTLYYKALIAHKDYTSAIPLVQENIDIYQDANDDFRLLHYYKQLYSLYGLSGDYRREEEALNHVMQHFKSLTGRESEEIILLMAQNYCRQQKHAEFNEITSRHNLEYSCE